MKNVWKFIEFIKTNINLSLVAMLWFAWLVYLLYKGEKMLTIMDNNGVLAISGFLLYLVFYVAIIEEYLKQFANNNQQEDNTDTKLVLEEFYKERDIKGFKKDILNKFVGYKYLNNYDKNYDKNEVQEENSDVKKQMQNAKQNKYNNSYLAFCMLIDRCKIIEFKENNDYQDNEKPYCFQEIAEAFELDWKGRRYLYYIAHSLLGTIGGLLEEYNKKEGKEKILCVNASVVTKWKRDHGNKWFCNGGIKTPAWCCYPPYTSKDGEDDRNFILELCKIVKEANDDKIENWKKTYYRLLEKKHEDENNKCKDNTCDLKSQNVLDEVYKNYKENETKMSYQELEKQAQKNKEKDNNNK